MSHEIHADYSQPFLLPPSLEDWVPRDHVVRFLRDFVRELDLAALGFTVRQSEDGRPNYSSELLLSAWLYGYMEKLRSSRKLEHAARTHLPLIWLLGMHYPDHNTLWRFYRANRKALRAVFRHSVHVAQRMGLVGMMVHALDGTKIAVHSASKGGLHRKALEQLNAEIDHAIAAMESGLEADAPQEPSAEPLPPALHEARERRAAIKAALETLDREGHDHTLPAEPEARMMTQHHGRTDWAYNAQAAVDKTRGIVVAQDVTNEATDYAQLAPMLGRVEETTGGVAAYTVADAGYRNAQQEKAVQKRGSTAVVAEHGREAENGALYPKSTFVYDEALDTYTCPEGKTLLYTRTLPPKGSGAPARVYRCTECRGCPVRDHCTTSRAGRTINRDAYEAFREQQRALRVKPAMKRLLQQRKGIIEHVFGHLKENLGFRRFSARGLDNARAQWALLCLTVNLAKIYEGWRQTLHPLRGPCAGHARVATVCAAA